MYPPILKVHLKKDQRMTYLMMLMQCFCVVVFSSDFFFIKAFVVGTHLNCIDNIMQFKWVPTTYVFTKK